VGPWTDPQIPELGPRVQRAHGRLAAALGRFMMGIRGWRVEGTFPDIPRMVLIVAPHTSNWDFIVGILTVFALGLRVRFLGKHTLFHPPLGWLMRWLGGAPVNRSAPNGVVAEVTALFAREDRILLGITPEGTRTRGVPWRSGFYNIAQAAQVPILPAAFDYARRSVRLFPAFEPTGNYEADLPKLKALYEGVRGWNE
jgi:1-acyl-sn-glycerol-3-phosphate acyltransferase